MEFAADTAHVTAQAHPAARTPREPPRFAPVGNQARLRRLQAKLTIGAVDDPLEHEADAVADQVMRMPEPCGARKAPAMVQRACAACEKDEKLQLKSDGPAASTSASGETVQDVLATSGQPLDATTRAFFEPRFGADFSGVRLHRDERAADSARDVEAHAYAVENHIVFAANKYAPGSAAGRHLLAHELAHVVQQGAVRQIRRLGDSGQSPAAGPGATDTVFICAKDLETSPLGRHAFFRIGGIASNNPTYELEPEDNRQFSWIDGDKSHSGCWQGLPKQDVAEDKSYVANALDCQQTAISLGCLQQQFASYPVGRYCTFGPNSNSFVAHIAKQCGLANPNPSGWTPGLDVEPPARGTFAPSPTTTMLGCVSETGCGLPAPSKAPGEGSPAAATPSTGTATSPRPQPKLEIGAVDDPLEREADRVAEQVMRMDDRALEGRPVEVRRKCAGCEEAKLQTRRDAPTDREGKTSVLVQDVLASPGRPLDQTTREFFEPRFGADFSAVRVHDHVRAADSARQIGAQAYAAGGDIVFGAGRYAPDSAAGRTLIAHELAHVIQPAAPTGPAATLRRQPEDAPSAPGSLDLAAADDLSAKNPKLAAFVAGFQRVLTASPKATVVATAFWSSKSAFEGQGGAPDVMRTAAAARAKDVKAALVTLGLPAEAITDTQSDLNEGTAQGPEGAVRLVVLQTPLALPQPPAIDPATVAAPAQAPGAPMLDLDKDTNPGTGNLALGELAKYQLAPKLKDPGGTVGVIAFVEDPGPVPAPDPGAARKDGAPPPDPAAARKQGEDRANTVRDTLIAGGVDAAFIHADTRFAPPNDPRIGHVWVQFVPKTATAAAASPLDFSKFTTLQLQTPRLTFVLKVPDLLALKTKFVEGKISFSPGASLKLKPVPGIPGLEIGISGELTSLSSLVGSSSPAPAMGGAAPPPASPPVKFSLSVAINGQGFKLEASTDVNLDNTQAALDNTPSALDNTPAGIHRGKITSGIYVTLIEPSVKYQIPSVVLNDLNSNGAKLQKAINALMSSPNPPAAIQAVGGPPAAPAGPQSTASSVLDIATAMASIADAMDKIDKAKKEKVAPKFKIGAGVTNPIGPPGPGGTSSNQPIPFVGASGTF